MKIKHYTFFSETHRIFLKYFLNTFPFDERVDLNIRFMPQECQTGEFVSDGWKQTMTRKVEYIIDAFNELNEGDIFIHTDADIIFIKPYVDEMLKEMQDADIIFQEDIGIVCMGLFMCKVTRETRKFFTEVLNCLPNHQHDQDAANALIRKKSFNLKIKLFSHKFFNHGFLRKHYTGEDTILLPPDMIMFHANFAVGVETKLKLIKLVLKHYNLN
jgi:hypothetical protein